MKTVAIITSQAFSMVNFRGPLIRDLAASGTFVYALAPDFDERMRQQIRDFGAEPVDFDMNRTSMSPVRDVYDMVRLTLLLRRLKPDVTLGYFAKPVIYGTLAAWIARVPRRIAMVEGLGYVFTNSGAAFPWHRRVLRVIVSVLYRVSLSHAHAVIFLNRDDIAEFQQNRLVDPGKVLHLGAIGVTLSSWSLPPPPRQPVTFILVARLLREKGVLEYAEAARLVKTRHPQVRFLLLGDLDQNPGSLTQKEVQSWVDDGILEWPGHVAVQPWLSQASVFVLPSYREGLPRSTQEAMAAGRAVITTDAPGCRETVESGVNGLFVPVRNSRALAEAMCQFVRQPALIDTMGQQSLRMAQERFDVSKVNARLVSILEVEAQDGIEVSISVVSHLQMDMVADLLRDLREYCSDTKIELILTLNKPEEVGTTLDGLPFPVRLIRNATPQGFGSNHNHAFKFASGKYFCVMNPDIRLSHNPLALLIESLSQAGSGVAGPLVYGRNKLLEDSVRQFPTPMTIVRRAVARLQGRDYTTASPNLRPDWVAGMFMLFQSQVFRCLQGFDERYFLYYEDVDICARLQLQNYKVRVCDDAKVIHYAQRSSHKSVRYLRRHISSMLRYFTSLTFFKLWRRGLL